MIKRILENKVGLVAMLCLILLGPGPNAFARDRDGRGERSHREVVVVGHDRYHYRDGRFYRPGWFGLEFAVFAPPIGAIVSFLPFGHRTVVVRGATYYYYDNIYYRACPAGYVVVPVPAVNYAVQTQALSGETVTINVPNSNGSYTAVTLVKHNNGYVGPQGEFYPNHPTVEQLKALYAK